MNDVLGFHQCIVGLAHFEKDVCSCLLEPRLGPTRFGPGLAHRCSPALELEWHVDGDTDNRPLVYDLP